MRRASVIIALIVSVVGIHVGGVAAPAAAAPPAGFSDTTVPAASDALSSPTDITALPDGRALVLEKLGNVRILSAAGVLLEGDALNLIVCAGFEGGLLGAAVDPSFATNGFVYLFYSRLEPGGNCSNNADRSNRVSRFTMSGNVINPASELVLLDKMNIQAGNHNGGDLHIGGDGKLYVAVGDAGANPRGGGASAAQDLSVLNGKIMRINLNGSVPSDNPLVGQANAQSCATAGLTAPTNAKCTEIYNWGLRNPYRFAFDPNSGNTVFFINDVGGGTWEEVDLGVKGVNYGWDTREGFCPAGTSSNCTPAGGFTDPITAYNHSTGCTFITAGVFVPNGAWPAQYDGSYLFADGGCGQVWRRAADGSIDYQAPFTTTSGTIVDMEFVVQGGVPTLYYVTFGDSQIHRITYTPPSNQYSPVVPTRVLETRASAGQVGYSGAKPAAGQLIELQITGVASVPSDASAVVLNITGTEATSDGFVTVWPCGVTRPTTSSLNLRVGVTTPNLVVSKIGTGGKVCLFTQSGAHLLADVSGYFPAVTTFVPLLPARVLETRVAAGQIGFTGPKPVAGRTIELTVAGKGGVPLFASTVVLNITGTEAAADGFVQVWPCDQAKPGLSSNLNLRVGTTVSNAVVSEVSADGKVCIFTQSSAHLIADVSGYFAAITDYQPLPTITPARVLETRSSAGQIGYSGPKPVAGQQITVHVNHASAVVLNVTGTEVTRDGFVTVWPCNATRPTASNLNLRVGVTSANAVVTKMSPSDTVCVYTESGAHLIVDVSGYVT